MSIEIKTTELPLASKLMQKGCRLEGFEVIIVRNRPVLEFAFKVEDQSMIDDFRMGNDGIAQYEMCRKMLVRICDTELKKLKKSRKVGTQNG